jgi:hypothetical protein
MAEDLELETPELVDDAVEQDPIGEDQTDPDPAKSEEPFLPVNDRTVYRTREDAIRGYNEAANRIASLSAWEKEAKQWGLADPRQLTAVAQELLELRKQVANAGKQAAPAKSAPADSKAKEAEQVKAYLKANGFISKEEQEEALKELRSAIQEMQQMGQQSTELRFQNQEAEARDQVAGWLESSGFKDDGSGTKLAVVGTLIKDWINNSDERVDQWSQGGVQARNLVRQGYDFATKALGWVPATTGKLNPSDPGYAAAKAKALATNKKLPAPGTAKGRGDAEKPKNQKGHINSALHDKAWALVESMRGSE